MRNAPTRLRSLLTALAPALTVVVLAASLVSAFHHHPVDRGHDQCAICSFGATPAVATTAAPAPGAPAFAVQRLHSPATRAPHARSITAALSRGPPSA
jgi:hypothetical protein